MIGLDVLGATSDGDDKKSVSNGVYAAIVIGVLALPFLLALPLLPGWFREQRAIRRIHKRIGAHIEQPERVLKPVKTARQEMIKGGLTQGEVNAYRRVLIARRKDAEEDQRRRNVEALQLAEIRRFAKRKAIADKRAATIASRRSS